MLTRRSHRTARALLLLLPTALVAFALGAVLAVTFAPTLRRSWPAWLPGGSPETASPALPPRKSIAALGRIEPRGGLLAVPGPPGDRVESIKVVQGETVAAEQVIAEMASRKDREEETRLARIQLQEAQEQHKAIQQAVLAKLAEIDIEVQQLDESRDEDVKAQEARVAVLRDQLRQAQTQVERLRSLGEGRIAPMDLEQQELALSKARGELAGAESLLNKTRNSYQRNRELALAKRRSAEAERDQALRRIPLESLRQALALAQRRLDLTQIKAPVAGRVIKVVAHAGEATGLQPILYLAAGEGLAVVAEVHETDLPLLLEWLGKGPVQLQAASRALATPLHGTLAATKNIASLVGPNRVVSLNPREDTDRRVVEVTVDLADDSPRTADALLGLQVDVTFEPAS